MVRCLRLLLLSGVLAAGLVPAVALAQPRSADSAAQNDTGILREPLPRLLFNGGLRFDSEGPGTPSILSGYLFAPLATDAQGSALFVDGFLNWNIANGSLDGGRTLESSVGFSSRLGYRWLNPEHNWILGINAGFDNRPFLDVSTQQVGVGIEALNPGFELRVNGAIPVGTTAIQYASNWQGVYGLKDDKLFLNRDVYYGIPLGGVTAEVGTPIARWNGGDLRLYAAYYYLDGDRINGTSGVRGRAEFRLSDSIALGGTVSYDNLFDTRATGYIRIGFSPQSRSAEGTVIDAEQRFLAQRGLPVERQRDVQIYQLKEREQVAARNPRTGKSWIVRCVGNNKSGFDVNCRYDGLLSALQAPGRTDVVLLAQNTDSDLGQATVTLPASSRLNNGASAPLLATQIGPVSLKRVFGLGTGSNPIVRNGTIRVGSDTDISGLQFINASITNSGTRNLQVHNNSFIGSATGLGAIAFSGVSNALIGSNTFIDPSRTALPGSATISLIGRAISFTDSDNIQILSNSISGATGEPIFIQNIGTSTNNLIQANTISGTRVSEDTNLEAGIFVRNTRDGYIRINDNTVQDNNNTAEIGYPAARGSNAADGIELNICRGTSFAAADRFTDGFGSCSGAATLTAEVTNNRVLNLSTTSGPNPSGAADGIDTNIGTNGTLRLIARNNLIANAGDEGFSMDALGTTQVDAVIDNNVFSTSGTKARVPGESGSQDGIAINISPNDAAAPTIFGASSQRFQITGNTITVDAVTANDGRTILGPGFSNQCTRGGVATPDCSAGQAEGIKLEVATGGAGGTVRVDASILNNTISTLQGETINLAIAEAATAGTIRLDTEITSNSLSQRFPVGNRPQNALGQTATSGDRLLRLLFSENATGGLVLSSAQITNNTFAALNTNTEVIQGRSYLNNASSLNYDISGNNLTNSNQKTIALRKATGTTSTLGLVVPNPSTPPVNYNVYLQTINTAAIGAITGQPASVTPIGSLPDVLAAP